MSYYAVSLPDDSLPWYVWADNANHAIRKVEREAGDATVNGRTRYRAAQVSDPKDVPTWYEVVDEPDIEKDARLYGIEE